MKARKKGVYEDEVKITFGMGAYTTSQKIKIKVIWSVQSVKKMFQNHQSSVFSVELT